MVAPFPSLVSGSHTFRQMDVGGFSSVCAVTKDDDLYCWGEGSSGALGNGGTADVTSPTFIMADIYSVDVGYNYACAIDNSGDAYCWGNEIRGHLGLGGTTGSTTPAAVSTSEIWLP